MKKNLTLIIVFLFFSGAYAQPNLAGELQTLYNSTIKPLFPIVIGLVFIVSVMMNINDIWGEHKNWKGFLSKVGLYVGICLLVVVVTNYLFTLSI